jgi:hypothetical protein
MKTGENITHTHTHTVEIGNRLRKTNFDVQSERKQNSEDIAVDSKIILKCT